MPHKDPEKKREYHNRYYKEVWYPKHKQDHAERGRKSKRKRAQENRSFINSLKKECLICMESDFVCLGFHHRDSFDKNRSISQMVQRGNSLDMILKEIEKCDVLCANCHMKIHRKEIMTLGD